MSWATYLVHPGAFDDSECDRLEHLGRTVFESEGAEQAGIEGLDESGALRKTSVAWIPRGAEAEWAFGRIESLAAASNATWQLDVEGITEDLQFTLYDQPGSHYTWHQDGLDDGVDDRKISVVVQLSATEDYDGADLEFLEVATDYDDAERRDYLDLVRPRGTAIVFSAFEYHRVTPLIHGARRSLVAWLSGPRFR